MPKTATKPKPAASLATASATIEGLQSPGAIAAVLAARIADGERTILYVAENQRRAALLAELVAAMAGDSTVAAFPAWDAPPLEPIRPSRRVMGQRMSTLRWLTDPVERPRLVVSVPAALMRRVPPRSIWQGCHLDLRVGDELDIEAVETMLRRTGYVFDQRVDEPGEAAIHGQVIDIFPAAAPHPCRIEHDGTAITGITVYDAGTQRSLSRTGRLIVDPASEIVQPMDEGKDSADPEDENASGEAAAEAGEMSASAFYGELETLFDYLPDADVIIEADAVKQGTVFDRQIKDSFEMLSETAVGAEHRPPPPERLFLSARELKETLEPQIVAKVVAGDADAALPVPRFAIEPQPNRAFARFAKDVERDRLRLILAAPSRPLLRDLRRRAARALGTEIEDAGSWAAAMQAKPGTPQAVVLPLGEGFISRSYGVAVIAAADLLGSRARPRRAFSADLDIFADETLSIGDVVVHLERGAAVLDGLEEVDLGDSAHSEVLSLRFRDGARLMVPVEEIGLIWRYGGEEEAVTLDRLDGESWLKRRNATIMDIQNTAGRLIELARQRSAAKARTIRAPAAEYERFCQAFAYELTPGQDDAVEAVLADLAAGRPMDRLVCGDVGFGKTEVAIRAIAAAALSGSQVALVAPTVPLVRQHLRTLRRRFAAYGIEVAELSRMTSTAEAKQVKAGLADGTIRIVVGTSAIAGKGVDFADLGLLVIDEEQKFGAKEKAKLRAKLTEGHVLTLTATPIPRTLEASFVGLQDLSVIATAPAIRIPVRTEVGAFDDGLVAAALRREHSRRGQSFVVCPRIEDIEPMVARLSALVPELRLMVAHGGMPAEDIDQAMLDFTAGKGDVLVSTNIVESGLDLPRANTLIVWRPDRFGLSQLHQLRGRVGRSSRRGVAFFLTDPDESIGASAERRLATLRELSGIGSGFDISARDLDLRGAGDLLGEDQAGHLQLLGASLYRQYLTRALAVAKGDAKTDEARPVVSLGSVGRIPPDYVSDADVRIGLYARLDRLQDPSEISAFETELTDRFAEPPAAVRALLSLARLRLACARLGISKLDGGPQGLAASFRAGAALLQQRDETLPDKAMRWKDNRLVYAVSTESAEERLELAADFLDTLGSLL
ncbi:helicase-related protein [Mangrovicella endophytica]|uniref:helicase-related protein n=1 Tax=Mangrovicella endophytica TaxID=2066697 RepID=UPI000C9E15DC|nr:helicase-related protein [Mangrovicella endophytica]